MGACAGKVSVGDESDRSSNQHVWILSSGSGGCCEVLGRSGVGTRKAGKTAEAAGLMKQAADLDPANAQVAKQAASMQEEASRGQIHLKEIPLRQLI